jgi:RNA polymerase sigma-70 factor (family 1)
MQVAYSEEELIQGLRRGDEVAVRQIYHLHYKALCYFADQLLHDKVEAEDVAVDSFLKLLQRKGDFENLKKVKGFLFTSTRNACFNLLERNKMKARHQHNLGELLQNYESNANYEEIFAKVLQIIYAEIEQLPPQTKVIFTSTFIDGKSTAVIATEMGISPKTVLNLKARALQKLRNKLYTEGYNERGLLLLCLTFLSAKA